MHKALDPKSSASTNSATLAGINKHVALSSALKKRKDTLQNFASWSDAAVCRDPASGIIVG